MTAYAHNSGYPGYWELRMAIWDSGEPLVVKAMALAILEYMRPDSFEANGPTRQRIRQMCGISENTLERHWNAISKWIDVIKRRGKVSVYRARIYACASELIEMVPAKPPQAMGGSKDEVPPTEHPTSRGYPPQSTPLSGGDSPAAYIDIKNNNNINNTDASAEELVHVNGVSITGPGFEMRYSEIDYAAVLASSTPERARAKAVLMANDWARRNFVPQNAISMLTSALRTDQLHHETYGHKLKKTVEELDASPPAPKPRPPQQPVSTEPAWLVAKKQQERADYEAELEAKRRYRARKSITS